VRHAATSLPPPKRPYRGDCWIVRVGRNTTLGQHLGDEVRERPPRRIKKDVRCVCTETFPGQNHGSNALTEHREAGIPVQPPMLSGSLARNNRARAYREASSSDRLVMYTNLIETFGSDDNEMLNRFCGDPIRK